MSPRIAAVIPARFASTRFPGKPLALLRGRPMIVHVCERAAAARLVEHLWVATDDERIAEAVRGAGFEARMTPADCASGSDRIAASLAPDDPWEILVNVQGDEPRIESSVIDAAIEALLNDASCGVSTVAVPIRDRHDFDSPHVVKVVLRPDGQALYFSRSPLPSPARLCGEPGRGADQEIGVPRADFVWGLKHLGLYVYRREVLMEYSQWPPTPLELRESLEQLRLLERGVGIQVAVVEHDSIGVDTPEELEKLNLMLLS